MAEGPRRPGQGLPPAASPRTTQPRVSAVSSVDRPLSRNKALEKLAADVDDPTTTMDPTDQTARQKFVNPEDLRTAIAPRGRVGTPLSTAVTAPQRNNTTYAQTQSGSSQSSPPPQSGASSPSQPYGPSPSYLQSPSSVQAQTGAQQAAAQARAGGRARSDTPLTVDTPSHTGSQSGGSQQSGSQYSSASQSGAQSRLGGRARVDTPTSLDPEAQAQLDSQWQSAPSPPASHGQSQASSSYGQSQASSSQAQSQSYGQSQSGARSGTLSSGEQSGAQSQSYGQSQSGAQSQSYGQSQSGARSGTLSSGEQSGALSTGEQLGAPSQGAPSASGRATPARGVVTEARTASMVSALAAAAGSSIAITEKSMPIAAAPPPSLIETAPRTQVWVATHKVPDDPDERLILLRDPDSARAASFRVLRHRLQERGDPRVIAVTSARAREGKTTCAVNLALALGECGRARVLLVEANLRAPSLAPLFGFMPPECFSTQLARHKEKPEDAWSVVEVYSPSLHVLAVKPDGDARPLLDGPAFRIAIEMLAQAGYDYIVIDTPPVLGAADVNLIEDSADGVLFVALSGSTPATALRQAIEQLQPAKLLGITLLDA